MASFHLRSFRSEPKWDHYVFVRTYVGWDSCCFVWTFFRSTPRALHNNNINIIFPRRHPVIINLPLQIQHLIY